MAPVLSACGVLCSGCAAYKGKSKGILYQEHAAAAWHRIYGFRVKAEDLACGGCLGPDGELFPTSLRCKARHCAISKGYAGCAACDVEPCPVLERTQSIWDGVPRLAEKLSRADFKAYAQPYCDPRRRLAAARAARAARRPRS